MHREEFGLFRGSPYICGGGALFLKFCLSAFLIFIKLLSDLSHSFLLDLSRSEVLFLYKVVEFFLHIVVIVKAWGIEASIL